MASIGDFALSAFSAQQQTHVGLIQNHVDFSLVKVDAPAEYHRLGMHLSPKRKEEAEVGAIHSTARKLGALFAGVLPSIPHLKKAYGLRTSEIAGSPVYNPRGMPKHGPLKSLIGADGTSIWAAATSGQGALETHLLACLLAFAFSGDEATAIWEELVRTRQAELLGKLKEETFPESTVFLARIEISRERLAVWDASARAWLRTADNAKRLQQTQLLHIVENLGLAFRSEDRMYDTVVDTWIESMLTIDKLVQGIAQSVASPAVLVGLCSWHIYPDLSALGTVPTYVRQNDPLVSKGGVMTLGIQNLNPAARGLTWSVQLQHLKYYGKPTRSTGSMNSASTRIAFDRLVLIAIGSTASQWGPSFRSVDNICSFLVAFAARHKAELEHNKDPSFFMKWIMLFGQQAQLFATATDAEKKEMLDFINFGRRRCRSFLLDPSPQMVPAFGLGSFEGLLSLYALDVERQIALLRYVAANYNLGQNLEGAIIQYDPSYRDEVVPHIPLPVEYADLVPSREPGHPRWRRWLVLPQWNYQALGGQSFVTTGNPLIDPDARNNRPRGFAGPVGMTTRRSMRIMESQGEPCGILFYGPVTQNKDLKLGDKPWISHELSWPRSNLQPSHADSVGDMLVIAQDSLRMRTLDGSIVFGTWTASATSEAQQHQQNPGDFDAGRLLATFEEGWRLGAYPHQYHGKSYRYLFGSKNVQVYLPIKTIQPFNAVPTCDLLTKALSDLPTGPGEKHLHTFLRPGGILDSGPFADAKLHGFSVTANDSYSTPFLQQFFQSMKVLCVAADVYNQLPDALVEMKITTRPLYQVTWVNKTLVDDAVLDGIENQFACISYMDTGKINLPPSSFTNAIAISSGDSLYVSEQLLRDPTEANMPCLVRHFVGNIGKPGLNLLGTVKDPVLRPMELDTWREVNHADWDGRLLDSFAKTTLQLSLTGYEMTFDVGPRGSKYKEVTYVEVKVAAYDAGVWAADIDVASQGWRVLPAACGHNEEEMADSSFLGTISAIDNWFELLDPPLGSAVVRANGNWMARSALGSALATQRGPFVVSPGVICWKCVELLQLGSRVIVLC